MLIRFTLENWKSFRDPVVFSMVASKERQHGGRVPRVAKYQARFLPIAAIYGGNASGKTNFFKALSFAKSLVVFGTRPDSPIAAEPFLLDSEIAKRPSRFCFELLIGERVYEFSFAVTHKAVIEERLVLITSTSEKVLYDRREGQPHFDESLDKAPFLDFAFRGTRDNQLFLTNSVSQKVENFRPVYDWFRDSLELVAPDARFEPFEQFLDERNPRFSTMNHLLRMLDTGIARLGGEDISFSSLPLEEPMKAMLREAIKEGESVRLSTSSNERFVIARRDGELSARKLVTYHANPDGHEVKFEVRHESDGSQRIIDLLPAFLELSGSKSKKVFIIDEIDRSLHTLLTRRLLESYLAGCSSETRCQLLMTTHDVFLMDQQLLRRDEMWVAERDGDGASTLVSFSEYGDVRYDKDVRKSYLRGRLGGIPRILITGESAAGHVSEDFE